MPAYEPVRIGDADVRLWLLATDEEPMVFLGVLAEVEADGRIRRYHALPDRAWLPTDRTAVVSPHDVVLPLEVSVDDILASDPSDIAALAALRHALEQVALARRIATGAHAGQTDKLGVDYLEHPRRVAGRLVRFDEQAVAWLHDVIEDTGVTADALRDAGVDERVVEAVLLLTRTGDDPDYYPRIAADPLARAVKLADVADNTDPARTALLDPATRERLAAKYAHARRALGAGQP